MKRLEFCLDTLVIKWEIEMKTENYEFSLILGTSVVWCSILCIFKIGSERLLINALNLFWLFVVFGEILSCLICISVSCDRYIIFLKVIYFQKNLPTHRYYWWMILNDEGWLLIGWLSWDEQPIRISLQIFKKGYW